ncbi:MAG: 16S rRNA (cytosine(1402)-N(4))-methyltransferase RsmH [Ruminococcaceae bacterium]|jgi:16S rRNA (cytosine1402-N4)-methyltransferase|nr:16S rRNA (cytosine(1402)-N(4))-methyltransferase RsmH [Oscillospiraceae bacterium]
MEAEQLHYSVLLSESIEALRIRPDGIYVDGTLGMGGHSEQIAKRLTTGRLIAIDRDASALERAGQRLAPYAGRITFVHGNFRDLPRLLDDCGVTAADGMLFDLGVSSPQLDEAERGFSYRTDAPLDMRMDTSESLTAWFVVNKWPEEKLKKILFEYGEERYAPRIASAIARRRAESPIDTTAELTEIIRGAMPAAALREKQHPAKRSFQAIRIAVNDELASISDLMDSAAERLNVGGRLAVISFHSLEDRIIKSAIASREHGCTCPRDFPVCTCGFHQTLKSVTRKPILPSEKELSENPRSRSAKLRVAERV